MGQCVSVSPRTPSVKSSCGAESAHTEASSRGGSHAILDAQHWRPVTDHYDVRALLGRGSYAVTRVAVERSTGRHWAVKSIGKDGLTPDERRRVRREASVLYHLSGHPNVVKLQEAYEDERHVHLVMELCSGGGVVDRILGKGAYTERAAAALIRSLLGAVAYAHDMGVMHRDIKIDNCMLLDSSEDAPLKLCDWGYASFMAPGRKLRKLCGTVSYLAPEVIAGCYDERADVWSCGVVLYALLSGRLPFSGKMPGDVIAAIRDNREGPRMSGPAWAAVSAPAKAAVRAMMTRDPAARPTARGALADEWVAGAAAGDNALAIEPEVLHRLKDYANMGRLKKHAAMVIARHLPEDQLIGLRLLFESMDRGGTGAVTASSLREALQRRGCTEVAQRDLQELLEHADLHGVARLDFPEFVAAELPPSALEDESNMRLAFDHFDLDHDGKISAPELARALAGDGEPPPTDSEAAGLLREADEDGDGGVDWREFKHMMQAPVGSCAAAAGAAPALVREDSAGYYDLY